MNKELQRAIQDLPELQKFVSRLLHIADDMSKTARYNDDDHFGFMGLSYLYKQIEHLRTIFILEERRDVLLIARSMIEGLCQLLWTATNKDNLAFKWRFYACVHDWRVLRSRRHAGEAVPKEESNRIEENVREYGPMFYSRQARRALKDSKQLPSDPYEHNWTGKTAKEIFDAVQGQILYKNLYAPFSDWHHWNVSGIGYAIRRDELQVFYSTHSIQDAATALATGFQCLMQTAEVVNDYLEMEKETALADLKNEYITFFSRRSTGAKS